MRCLWEVYLSKLQSVVVPFEFRRTLSKQETNSDTG